jgi:hypothetical protein
MVAPDRIVCINLKSRRDRRIHMKKQARRHGFDFTFYTARKHVRGGVVGNRESHIAVLRTIRPGERVLILEDDCVFSSTPDIPELPNDYDILYLGATMKGLDTWSDTLNLATVCWATHAYVPNPDIVPRLIADLENYDGVMDEYLVREIQPRRRCFIPRLNLVTQLENDKSDVGGELGISTANAIPYPPAVMGKWHDAPMITVVTVTKNRPLDCAISAILDGGYPLDRIEWIVVNNGTVELPDTTPDALGHIIHVRRPGAYTVAALRNMAVSASTTDFIVHIDDDDLYTRDHIVTRMCALTSADCVGCSELTCLNVRNETAYRIGTRHSALAEASMAYRRDFWTVRPYDERLLTGESVLFLAGRPVSSVVQVDSEAVIYAVTHDGNLTGELRAHSGCSNGYSQIVSQFQHLQHVFPLHHATRYRRSAGGHSSDPRTR